VQTILPANRFFSTFLTVYQFSGTARANAWFVRRNDDGSVRWF
jgi:hypothetical protein